MSRQSNFAGNIAYDDLREWLAMAERLGEVRTVKGANCEEDIGSLPRRCCAPSKAPASCSRTSRVVQKAFACS